MTATNTRPPQERSERANAAAKEDPSTNEYRVDHLGGANDAALRELFDQVAEGAEQRERDDRNPFEAVDLVRDAGLGAFRLPVDRGGSGGSLRDLFGVLCRLAEADPQVAHILRSHFLFVEEQLRDSETDSRSRWLEQVRQGAVFGNATAELSKNDAGSLRWETQLTPDGRGFRLNGAKFFTTGTLFADFVYVVAGTASGAVARVVVPVDRPGVRVRDDWDGFGQRLTGSGSTTFEDVSIEPEEVFPFVSAPDDGRLWYSSFQQLYLQAVIVGVLRGIVRDAVALAHGRNRTYSHAAGATPAEDPQLQQVIGTLASNAYVAEVAVLAAADAQDRAVASVRDGVIDPDLDHQAALEASKAKVVVDDLGQRSATQLFDVGGASATRRSANLDRHWRNVRTLSSHNPTLYKARVIGEHHVNGILLPRNGYF